MLLQQLIQASRKGVIISSIPTTSTVNMKSGMRLLLNTHHDAFIILGLALVPFMQATSI